MRLAGITWWRNNYGSILQAYALQRELNSLAGIEYEIINQYGKKIVSADNFIDKLHTIGLKKTINRVFWKFGFKKLRKRSYSIQGFVDEHLRVSERQYNQDNIEDANAVYDGFICGSDQIWNPTLTGTDSMYWLTFADKSKLKISYAPSIGVKELNTEQEEQIRESLKDFTAISCREESGTELINSVLKKERCVTVLDPTLMVDRLVWDELCTERKYKFKYIFVYMLRGSKAQRKQIETFAKKKKLKIITMPFLETEHI
ncbi:MAG: polysaccharide pyruvyl transferase family protein, partial [Suilimivivens sp.]